MNSSQPRSASSPRSWSYTPFTLTAQHGAAITPCRSLQSGHVLTAAARVVAGQAAQLGGQPGRGEHPEQPVHLARAELAGRDDQVEAFLGERNESQAAARKPY